MPSPQQQNNSVNLNLADYLALYEFKRNLEKKKFVCKTVITYTNYGTQTVEFISPDDAIKAITEINDTIHTNLVNCRTDRDKWHTECQNKNEQIRVLKDELRKATGETLDVAMNIDQVKKLSLWQFLKWRKKK